MQIGKPATSEGSNSQTQLGQPGAHGRSTMRRASSTSPTATATAAIIVFDTKTGAYKRHWGAGRHQDADRRQAAALQPERAAVAELRQSGALRAAVERRAGLCLRPRQRPHPGVPQGRHVREGVPRRAADAGERLGLGPGAVQRSAAEIHLHGRRRQRPDQRAGARGRQGARRSGAATAASPANSSGCTTSRSIRRATSTPPRSASAAACRNSLPTRRGGAKHSRRFEMHCEADRQNRRRAGAVTLSRLRERVDANGESGRGDAGRFAACLRHDDSSPASLRRRSAPSSLRGERVTECMAACGGN